MSIRYRKVQNKIDNSNGFKKWYNIIERGDFKEDESAKTFKSRPVMQEILHYIKTHKKQIDKLLFIRWNRFSRDLTEAPKW